MTSPTIALIGYRPPSTDGLTASMTTCSYGSVTRSTTNRLVDVLAWLTFLSFRLAFANTPVGAGLNTEARRSPSKQLSPSQHASIAETGSNCRSVVQLMT
jgi:hypothetical protein